MSLIFIRNVRTLPPFTASETVEYLFVPIHRKRRRLLLMKGADSEKVLSSFFECDIFRDQINDIRPSFYLFYLIRRNVSFQCLVPLLFKDQNLISTNPKKGVKVTESSYKEFWVVNHRPEALPIGLPVRREKGRNAE